MLMTSEKAQEINWLWLARIAVEPRSDPNLYSGPKMADF
jgi:hypothetical protein